MKSLNPLFHPSIHIYKIMLRTMQLKDTSPLTPNRWAASRNPLFFFVPTVCQEKVLANHSQGLNSPKYSAGSGKEFEYQPIDGIPAAIAVNLGKTLSYAWDTTECIGRMDFRHEIIVALRSREEEKVLDMYPRLYGFVF